jgi:hypothetical protein
MRSPEAERSRYSRRTPRPSSAMKSAEAPKRSPGSRSRASSTKVSGSRKSHSSRRSASEHSRRMRSPTGRRSSRNRRDDYSVSSGSDSEDTEANSEGKLDDQGLVVNASDLSECWSKISLNSDEETAFQRFTTEYEAKKGLFYFGNEDDISLPSIGRGRLGSLTQASVDEQYDEHTMPSDDSSGIVKRTETYRTEAVQDNLWMCGLDDDSFAERSYGGLRNNEVLIAAAGSMKTYDTRGMEDEEDSKEIRQDHRDAEEPVWPKTRFDRKAQKRGEKRIGKKVGKKVEKKVGKEVEKKVEKTVDDTPAKTKPSLLSTPLQWWYGNGSTNQQEKEDQDEKESQERIENAKRDLLIKPNLVVERSPGRDGTSLYLNGRVRKDVDNTNESSRYTKFDLNGRVNRFPKKSVRQARRNSMRRGARLKIRSKNESMSLVIATDASKAMRSQYAVKEEGTDGAFVRPARQAFRSPKQQPNDLDDKACPRTSANNSHRSGKPKKEGSATVRGSVLPLQITKSLLSTHEESPSFDCPGQGKAAAKGPDHREAIESPTPLSTDSIQGHNAFLDRRASIQDDIQETTFYTVWSAVPSGSMIASDNSHTDSAQTAINSNAEPHVATDSCQKQSSSKISEVPESNIQSLIRCFEERNASGGKESNVEAIICPDADAESLSTHLDADCNVSISSNSAAVDVRSDSSATKSEESSIAARDEPEQSFNSNLLFLGSTDHESLQPVMRQRRRESGTGTTAFDYYGDITKEALQPKSSSPRSRSKSSKKCSIRSSSTSRPGSMASKNAIASHSHSHSHSRDMGWSVSSKMLRELDEVDSKGNSLGSSAMEEQMAQGADSFFDALEDSISVD